MQIFNIEQFLSLEGYEESRLLRRKGVKSTQEFFTPYSIVKRMCDKIPESDWNHPLKTFCEPCFGNGQFVIYIIYNRIIHGINWRTALETCYGIELMSDNVSETKERILNLLYQLDLEGIIDFNNKDRDKAMEIMNHNLICHDFFTWNFEQWREYTEDELKELKKK